MTTSVTAPPPPPPPDPSVAPPPAPARTRELVAGAFSVLPRPIRPLRANASPAFVESAPTNTRQCLPTGARYVREAWQVGRDCAFPSLARLVRSEPSRVEDSISAGNRTEDALFLLLVLALAALVTTQIF